MPSPNTLNKASLVAHCDAIRTQLLDEFDYRGKRMHNLKGQGLTLGESLGSYRFHTMLLQNLEQCEVGEGNQLDKPSLIGLIERRFIEPGKAQRFTEDTELSDHLPVDVADELTLWKAASNFLKTL